MTEHLYTYQNPCNEKDIARIVNLIERGGIIAYPTDVNWAFACDAADVKAIDRIRRLKPHKAKEQPFSLVCRDIAMAADIANIDHIGYRLLKKALPGPFTVILTTHRNLARQLKDKRRVVGIRIPDSELVLKIVETLGRPLVTTSVPSNEEGMAPHFGYEVYETFGHGIDLLVDLGEELPGIETTVVDLTSEQPVLVRRGAGDPALFGIDE